MGLGEEMRAERAARRIKAIGVLPQADEHFLGDVFGEGSAAGDLLGESEHDAGMALIHLSQRSLVAVDESLTSDDVVKECGRGDRVQLTLHLADESNLALTSIHV
jgi:hypothetical protein